MSIANPFAEIPDYPLTKVMEGFEPETHNADKTTEQAQNVLPDGADAPAGWDISGNNLTLSTGLEQSSDKSAQANELAAQVALQGVSMVDAMVLAETLGIPWEEVAGKIKTAKKIAEEDKLVGINAVATLVQKLELKELQDKTKSQGLIDTTVALELEKSAALEKSKTAGKDTLQAVDPDARAVSDAIEKAGRDTALITVYNPAKNTEALYHAVKTDAVDEANAAQAATESPASEGKGDKSPVNNPVAAIGSAVLVPPDAAHSKLAEQFAGIVDFRKFQNFAVGGSQELGALNATSGIPNLGAGQQQEAGASVPT